MDTVEWTEQHEREFRRSLREIDVLTALLDTEGRWTRG